MANTLGGIVTAVSRSGTHTMSKPNQESIQLLAGLGVAGDAHQGETVKHRSRVKRDPTQPNLRQVHLIHEELFAAAGLKNGSVMASVGSRPNVESKACTVADQGLNVQFCPS